MNLVAVDQDFAALDVVEPKEQVCNSGFTTSRTTNQGDLESSWNLHVEVVKNFDIPRRILEVDVHKVDLAAFNLLDCSVVAISHVESALFINDRKDFRSRVFRL